MRDQVRPHFVRTVGALATLGAPFAPEDVKVRVLGRVYVPLLQGPAIHQAHTGLATRSSSGGTKPDIYFLSLHG